MKKQGLCIQKRAESFDKIKKGFLSPSIIFESRWPSEVYKKITYIIAIFISFGIIFNYTWPFPNFIFFSLSFSFILFVTLFTLKNFYKNMRVLRTEVILYQPFTRSNYFFWRKTNYSLINILFPVCFIIAFGVGGSFIYSTIEFTPTFIWCLVLFSIVVYFSMLAYLQYIRFFFYLHMSANNNLPFEKIISPDKEELPPNLPWLVRITKISHSLRNMFFLVGGSYIALFAVFCFSEVYDVRIDAVLFYFLWIIIFIFIVLVFPFITRRNMINIKKIVRRTKEAYIHELLFEQKTVSVAPSQLSDKVLSVIRNYCISIILNTSSYPMKGKLNIVSSVLATLINLLASIVTILQYQGISLF